MRVPRPRKAAPAAQESPETIHSTEIASGLPPDSLALSLLLGARVIAAVRAGKSLTQALAVLHAAPPAARAAAQDIAYGTLRRYAAGEFILGQLLERALPHPEVEALLLGALYRLQTRPESVHVVVDQAVAAAGGYAAGAFKRLVNGVLRNYLRQRDGLHSLLAADDEAAQQHPRWWLGRLRRAYPDRWQDIVVTGNGPPPLTVRVNRRRALVTDYLALLQEAGLPARRVGRDALLVERAVPVDSLPGFREGLVSVQDAGAQRAAQLLAPRTGQRILDACAAPGGKTSHLLELADVDLLAIDIDRARAQLVEDNLRRLRLTATVQVADCRNPGQWWDGRPFDAILADVPCSASGVVRRHPDLKYLRRESAVRNFVRTQAEILDRLWPLLKAGGKLLYATCSLFPEENGAQIDAFLVRQPLARRLAEESLLPREEHDGFFYALLRKAA